jgi:hypothetical protein
VGLDEPEVAVLAAVEPVDVARLVVGKSRKSLLRRSICMMASSTLIALTKNSLLRMTLGALGPGLGLVHLGGLGGPGDGPGARSPRPTAALGRLHLVLVALELLLDLVHRLVDGLVHVLAL